MIISASYKTDIPAFYSKWFMNRLKAGYCKIVNPYGKQVYRVDLQKEAVDGFVFWTKNIGPFMKTIKTINAEGYPFIIQYAVTGYPRALEFSVVDAEKSIRSFRELANNYGSQVVVWRYDTIVLSSLTPYEFHLVNFERLAKQLEGSTDEVVVSFAQIYRKTLRNMNWASKEFGFTWFDPDNDLKLRLASELAQIARTYRMQLTMCSQPEYLAPGVKEAHCIDIQRLSAVANRPIHSRLKGNRRGCACYYSRDIGEYDTCPHGCVYCYAVQNRDLAKSRYKSHDPESEFLFPPEGYVPSSNDEDQINQPRLF
ncbi:MAG: DUF1848 domain-containing protein [Anaerolineaceae bacterium]|nr:DUF1848 domain-containing protein [Anaerolineaceae bacterium]